MGATNDAKERVIGGKRYRAQGRSLGALQVLGPDRIAGCEGKRQQEAQGGRWLRADDEWWTERRCPG